MTVPSHAQKPLDILNSMYSISSNLYACVSVSFLLTGFLCLLVNKAERRWLPRAPMFLCYSSRYIEKLILLLISVWGKEFQYQLGQILFPVLTSCSQEVQLHCRKMAARKPCPGIQDKAKGITVRWKDNPKNIYFVPISLNWQDSTDSVPFLWILIPFLIDNIIIRNCF